MNIDQTSLLEYLIHNFDIFEQIWIFDSQNFVKQNIFKYWIRKLKYSNKFGMNI